MKRAILGFDIANASIEDLEDGTADDLVFNLHQDIINTAIYTAFKEENPKKANLFGKFKLFGKKQKAPENSKKPSKKEKQGIEMQRQDSFSQQST